MIQERLFIMMALMIVSPFIFILVLPDPYATVATLGSNLFMLLYIRKFWKGMASNLMGANKAKWYCMVCQGNKFDGKGSCKRCGSRSRKLG